MKCFKKTDRTSSDDQSQLSARSAQSRHRDRRANALRLMRAHRSLETEDDNLREEIEISDKSKASLKNMRELSKSMVQTNP